MRLVGLIGFVVLVGLVEVDRLFLIVDIVEPTKLMGLVALAGLVRPMAVLFVRLPLFLLAALVDFVSGGLCAS